MPFVIADFFGDDFFGDDFFRDIVCDRDCKILKTIGKRIAILDSFRASGWEAQAALAIGEGLILTARFTITCFTITLSTVTLFTVNFIHSR